MMSDEARSIPQADPRRRLEASEARFRTLIERNADGVVVVCGDGTICYVNPAAETLLGRPRDDVDGEPFGIPICPGETTEVDIPRPDGQPRVAEMRVVETLWEDRPAFLASLRDITERKRDEDALRASEERFRMISEVTSDFTYSFQVEPDGALVLEWLTGAFTRIAGYTPMELQLRGYPDIVHPDDRAAVIAHLDRSRAGEPGVCEHRVVTKDGRVRWLRDHARPVRDPVTGRVVRVYGAGQDITEPKRLDTELRQRLRELAEADRQKNLFLAMLAHELRNPLAPVQNAVQILRRVAHGDPMLERTREIIESQVKHMVRLVDDLLDVSRITRGKIELKTQPIDVAAAVDRAVEVVRPEMERKALRLTVTKPAGRLRIEADPTRLEQVLVNLLTNAIKYTDDGGRVEICAGREGDEAVIRVGDSGIGIAPEMLPRVFDLFTQADGSLDRSQGGLGIGLTLVKKLVELHGGRVDAGSDGLGHGSEFTVRMPALAATPGEVGTPAPVEPRELAQSLRVLVVDDNIHAAESLSLLVRLWGHDVRVAHDGPDAIEAACDYRPDVLLLDIGLPRMDGYKVARRLRERPDFRELLLVAMTGYGQEEDRRRSREAGFDHHLVKPVDLEVLEVMLSDPAAHVRPRSGDVPA